MTTAQTLDTESARPVDDPRRALLSDLPVRERRAEAAGIATAVLEGGEGPPLILLHGPGESAVGWLRVIPRLVRDHRVVAPDLPAHGESEVPDGTLDEERVLDWLDELIRQTCPSPPILVGHVLGGAIGARFAASRGDRLRRLVLVDSLGLGRFRPSLGFGLTLVGFLLRPTEGSYDRFMRQCSHDLDGLRDEMGERWKPFASYNLQLARSESAKAAGGLMWKLGVPRIPPEDLEAIPVPTTLIWGREDRANRLRIAEAASDRYGWPLHVIDECADDPARDRPDAFLEALGQALGSDTPGDGSDRPPST